MRPVGDRAVEKSLQRLRKRGLIEAFDAEGQRRKDGKPEKVYAAITAVNKGLNGPSRGDINESVSDSIEPASSLGFANPTPNPTTPPVGFQNTTPPAQPHPDTDEVEKVYPSPTRQLDPVGFKEVSDSSASAQSDNLGERVEEVAAEGDLEVPPRYWGDAPPAWEDLI
jgi:hypothetical protein